MGFRFSIRSRLRRALLTVVTVLCVMIFVVRSAPPAQLDLTRGTLPYGVNLWGYVRGEFGVGEAARLTASALLARKIHVALNDLHFILPGSEPHRHTDTRLEKYGIANHPRAPYFFNIIQLNADMQPMLYARLGPSFYRNHYNIGVWYWELGKLPENFHSAFWYLDEIWAVTEFMASAFRKVAAIPVLKLPCPVAVLRPERTYTRQYFSLQESDFVFMFSFDFASLPERKNPWAVINAFMSAFPSPNNGVLLIKSTNFHHTAADREAFAGMKAKARGSRILFLEKHLSADEVAGLFSIIDVYVSLHRSEGLGLGMLQALELGKIVIATNYSGNADFTNDETAYVVPYHLVPLREDYGPYKRGNVWADADSSEAARWMRYVFENQEEARLKALKAKAWIDARYSDMVTGAQMQERLEQIWTDRAALLRYLNTKQRNVGRLPEPEVPQAVQEEDREIRRQQLISLVWACGLTVDEEHYLEVNKDLAKASVDPFRHWQESGLREGRQYRLVRETEPRNSLPELCGRVLSHPEEF